VSDTSGLSALFDPPDTEWHPVSPRLARVRVLITAVCAAPFVVASVIVAIATRTPWVYAFAAGAIAIGLWIGILAVRRVRSTGYAERGEDFLVRKGIMFRSVSVVPYGRMQYVDVTVGPLAAIFHISTLTMNTAAQGLDVTIPGLPPEEAARLRDELATKGHADRAGL
jgi:membrane protein YdbS with pleckstrin-like domain